MNYYAEKAFGPPTVWPEKILYNDGGVYMADYEAYKLIRPEDFKVITGEGVPEQTNKFQSDCEFTKFVESLKYGRNVISTDGEVFSTIGKSALNGRD